jgi:uncharacterized repeat protein (TIGR03806 family)
MKQNYFLRSLFILSLFIAFTSCNDDEGYTPVPEPPVQVSPVDVNLANVPYPTLSQYKFFTGEMKNMEPAYKVIPYDLNSTLFTDYAHKKRFVWMPENTSATYNGDANVLDFPNGTVLIKNFYYDNVQPSNTRKIIETRLMIMKDGHWVFANYLWNDAQTEATLDMAGKNIELAWTENGMPINTTYRIPSANECFTCHKAGENPTAIGPKPQNINKAYAYSTGSMNQLSRWIQEGYLNTAPQNISSTVNWTDTSKSLEMRVRSYLDINCAHCHTEGAHCDYRPIRLAFTETANPENLGVCVNPHEFLAPGQQFIIERGSAQRSVMYYRMNSTDEAERMPLMGRTVNHTEALQMMQEWISGLGEPCPQ